MEGRVTFEAVEPGAPEAEELMALLDAEIREAYGDKAGTGALTREEHLAFEGVFLLARRGGVAAACGAVRVYGGGAGEVRRVYALPQERGSGLARALMGELERRASELGLSRLVLETGDLLGRAIGFYEALGYRRIPRYGDHVAKRWAVCYEKRLGAARGEGAGE